MRFLESQKRVIKQLEMLVIKERVSHAFLFDGVKQAQKLETAYYFAKTLLCSNPTNGVPCLKCNECTRVDSRNHPNVTYIEPDGLSIKIEQIRDLQKSFRVTGLEENRRIYIINNVEFLTPGAANSLLKFLEEPQEGVHAILLTDNMHKVINTIVSRCQIINFVKPDYKLFISSYLEAGYNAEAVTIASLVSGRGEELEDLIDDEEFELLLSSIKDTIKEFLRNKSTIICELPELWHKNIEGRKNTIKGVDGLMFFYRDVLNNKLGNEIEYYHSSTTLLSEVARKSELKEILENIELIFDAKRKLESNVNAKLVMDQLFMKLKGC